MQRRVELFAELYDLLLGVVDEWGEDAFAGDAAAIDGFIECFDEFWAAVGESVDVIIVGAESNSTRMTGVGGSHSETNDYKVAGWDHCSVSSYRVAVENTCFDSYVFHVVVGSDFLCCR